ncbi:MAG: endonuclease/exonuclease/phosphatase family protein [Flavobacterium sp.]|uniref:endonuclease/exonuclease/phosphatase family protein n=1 Tax=Flavobacterium sp. TaxID=239 RepID=UPI003267E9DE
MKIIQWNCNMAFRKKHAAVLASKPDIVVICECENNEKLKFGSLTPTPNDFFWHGNNKHKGIGIFSYSDYKFELVAAFNPEFRYIIPLKVSNKNEEFYLLAIWAMDNKEKKEARYIAQVWLAINHYSELLDKPIILVGDFNSNQIWDKEKRIANHTGVVKLLSENNIHSLYHKINSENHGEETQPTFFLHRNKEKPYHLDYCFASGKFWEKGFSVTIGDFDEWIKLSDHLPIEIEFK